MVIILNLKKKLQICQIFFCIFLNPNAVTRVCKIKNNLLKKRGGGAEDDINFLYQLPKSQKLDATVPFFVDNF